MAPTLKQFLIMTGGRGRSVEVEKRDYLGIITIISSRITFSFKQEKL